MVEYYGWLNISESLDGENETNILKIISDIQDRLPLELRKNRFLELKAFNGSFVLNCAGVTNRHNAEIDFILSLFNDIAKKAVGTYGLLYLKKSDLNYFEVIKVSKGEIVKIKDSLLSPCMPKIEDNVK